MLITLMLAVALMSIALLAVLPAIRLQVQRDREEEMRHRGTAYMRAIQHYFKKFGRYPTRIEELENTNNIRFLRKRYKDPINRTADGKEKDFKLLHQQDISLNNGPVLGQMPGQSPFGGPGGGPGGSPGQALAGGSGFGGNRQGGLSGGLGALGTQPGVNQQPGTSESPTPTSGEPGEKTDAEGGSNSQGSASNSNTNPQPASGFNGPTFGGGPILGVASASKQKSVRVFFEKNRYNDWLFIYVPNADRGGLLTGPVNPGASTGNLGGIAPGVGGALPQGQGPGQPNVSPPVPGVQPPQSPGQTGPEE
jgi:type II secretory pathway pseudopilin PulG